MNICTTKGSSNINIAKYILHVKSNEKYLTLMIVLTEHRCNNPAILSECRWVGASCSTPHHCVYMQQRRPTGLVVTVLRPLHTRVRWRGVSPNYLPCYNLLLLI